MVKIFRVCHTLQSIEATAKYEKREKCLQYCSCFILFGFLVRLNSSRAI